MVGTTRDRVGGRRVLVQSIMSTLSPEANITRIKHAYSINDRAQDIQHFISPPPLRVVSAATTRTKCETWEILPRLRTLHCQEGACCKLTRGKNKAEDIQTESIARNRPEHTNRERLETPMRNTEAAEAVQTSPIQSHEQAVGVPSTAHVESTRYSRPVALGRVVRTKSRSSRTCICAEAR